MLTKRQRRLVGMIEYRVRYQLPTVQRDLAEALGIRLDSLNKLLSRTRRRLAAQGGSLELPPRYRDTHTPLGDLPENEG